MAEVWSFTGRSRCSKTIRNKFCCATADAGPSKLQNPLADSGGAAETAPDSQAFAFYRRGAPRCSALHPSVMSPLCRLLWRRVTSITSPCASITTFQLITSMPCAALCAPCRCLSECPSVSLFFSEVLGSSAARPWYTYALGAQPACPSQPY